MSVRPVRRSACFTALCAIAVAMLAACSPSTTPLPAQSGSAAQSPVASGSSPAPARSPAAGGSSGGSATAPQACPPAGSATALTGAGATFPAPLYTRWFAEYNSLCRVQINYQAIGSGGGISQHTNRTVDFGASDGILTAAQASAAPGTLMIPMTAGSVVVVVNLQGMQNAQLRLDSETLAGIFLGDITRWNDARLASINSGVSLPGDDIVVVHRSDGSGTTNIFTNYLAKVSPSWQSRVGTGNSVNWPTGLGGEQNAGVAGQVRQLPGSIGYVELAYAIQNQMTMVSVQNAAGQFIQPSIEATTAAMKGVDLPGNMQVMITNSTEPTAYPIAGFTWILVYEGQTDRAKAQSLVSFLWWALHDGQTLSTGLTYAPLSPEAVDKAEELVRKIQVNGQPVLPF